MMRKKIETSCSFCGRKGVIFIAPVSSPEQFEVTDRIPHKRDCSTRTKQPEHLRKKGRWRRGERRGNELVGARNTQASGSLNEDADGRVFNQWRVETKTTKNLKFRLARSVWKKLHDGALSAMEEPVLYLEIEKNKFVMVRKCLVSGERRSLQPAKKSISIAADNATGVINEWAGSPVLITTRQFKEVKQKWE